jgi:hypothetical protein
MQCDVQYTFSALKVPCQLQSYLHTSYSSLHSRQTLYCSDFCADTDADDGVDGMLLCVSDL